ncbi:NAD(P)-dependent oxidoreductase [Companilactobacillus zhachilii]|uniref:NAD(P)-dependent oxidoreductase n=1 Tax=Companilactobacillus zhachilii TaxID=2304606 RepID=UPI0040340F76
MRKIVILTSSYFKNKNMVLNILKKKKFEIEITQEKKSDDDEEVANLIGNADGLIVENDVISEKVLNNCKNLKIVAKLGNDFENIDVDYARSKGIEVLNVIGAEQESYSEMAWLMLMMLNRNSLSDITQFSDRERLPKSIFGKNIGIIGFDAKGRKLARIAAGFNMNIYVHDCRIKEGYIKNVFYQAKVVPYEYLLKNSDFVIVSSTSIKEASKGINKQMFDKLRPDAIIVIIDEINMFSERDLYSSLTTGKLKAAGIIFKGKGLSKNNRLPTLSNFMQMTQTDILDEDTKEFIENQSVWNILNYFD